MIMCVCLTSHQQLRSYGDGGGGGGGGGGGESWLNVLSARLDKLRIEPAIPGLPGDLFSTTPQQILCILFRECVQARLSLVSASNQAGQSLHCAHLSFSF